jgi:hypothetical protein
MGVSGQLHAPVALFQWNETPAPLNIKLCGPHSESGCVYEVQYSCFSQILNTELPDCSPVTKPVMIVVSAMTEFKSIIIDNKVKEEHAR